MTDNPYNEEEAYDEYAKDYTSDYMFYPDDERFFARMIGDMWNLSVTDADKDPKIYFDLTMTSTRDNSHGGSILIMASPIQRPLINSIGYRSVKLNRTITIDVQNPKSRNRHYAWVREIGRILRVMRDAGRTELGGWDYMELPDVTSKSNQYTNFYHSVITVKLVKQVQDL